MDYVHIGIAITIGILFGYIVISTIYFILYDEINEIRLKYKEKIINKRRKKEEPTVCEKLGEPKIYPSYYKIIQAKKRNFDKEKENAYTLIEFIFPAPQITYNKFYNDVTRLNKAFEKQYNSLHLYFRAYPREDAISHKVIIEGIDNLTEFSDKLEDLIKELSQLVVCDKSTENLIKDMENETKSIKNYEKVI